MEPLFIHYGKLDEGKALTFLEALKEKGYEAKLSNVTPKESDFVLLLFSKDTKKEDLLSCNPWLEEQFDHSSYRGFRLMPVLIYSSSFGLEKTWESGVGDLIEELLSGEFKPFGFDLDENSPLKEFPRILEEYSE